MSMETPSLVRRLKSIEDGAAELGISKYTLRNYAKRGLVATVLIGRRRLISDSELARIAQFGVSAASEKA